MGLSNLGLLWFLFRPT